MWSFLNSDTIRPSNLENLRLVAGSPKMSMEAEKSFHWKVKHSFFLKLYSFFLVSMSMWVFRACNPVQLLILPKGLVVHYSLVLLRLSSSLLEPQEADWSRLLTTGGGAEKGLVAFFHVTLRIVLDAKFRKSFNSLYTGLLKCVLFFFPEEMGEVVLLCDCWCILTSFIPQSRGNHSVNCPILLMTICSIAWCHFCCNVYLQIEPQQ